MSVEFIAEVSSNHNRDLERCLKFIEVAKHCGCQGIKFQLFKIDKLFAPEVLLKNEEIKKRKKWELPLNFISYISKKCKEVGLKFVCTPFYLEAVDELYPFVDAYKIASYELLWKDLFIKCARTLKPIIFSTGMATLDEVKSALDILVENGCTDITILHCTSSYPASPDQCNLSAIQNMRSYLKKFSSINIKFGWSDHSVNEGVIFRAIYKWGAELIELHLDLDKKGEEFVFGHCWLPKQLKQLIKKVNDGLLADGDGKKEPKSFETKERMWRADPIDGLRPLRHIRKNWLNL